MIKKLVGMFSNTSLSNNSHTLSSASSHVSTGTESKIPINPRTDDPTKAWNEIKVKQTVTQVETLDPATEICDDKIRFVCLSDTHSQIEKSPAFVPPGDVVLHAGDFTQLGFPKHIHLFNEFLGTLPHKVKIVIAGNHDLTLDEGLVRERRSHLRNAFRIHPHNFEDDLEVMDVKCSRDLLTNCIYLKDSALDVCGIKLYGSPWQPEFCDWGFNLPRGQACLDKWDMIPDDTDILMTHGPPIGHGDLCVGNKRAGCVELLSTIQTRVKPKYHVFGHIHEGYGCTTDGQTVFINASNCSLRYKLVQPAVVFDFPIPEGHTKAELLSLPVNNISL